MLDGPPSAAFDLTGRCAVVTGGSKGIGLAIARGLADHGAHVALWARGQEALANAAQQLRALPVVCDVTDRSAVRRAMQETTDAFGQIDVLVANAGRPGEDMLFPDIADADWDAIVGTNLTGVYNAVRPFADHAIARGGGGKVIVVSSIAAEIALPLAVAYASAKAGLIGFTRSAAVALARHGVQVNCVEPGWVETDMTGPQREDERARSWMLSRTPARRFGRAEDLAGICVYLASTASDFHTGDTIRVDGGFVVG